MITSSINQSRKESGFTIVELLVVIVVIGILAAITIVSYAGITGRAKTTQASSLADSVQSVAEAMNADNGYYPKTIALLTAGSISTKLPAGITMLLNAAPNLSTNKLPTEIKYEICGADATVTGNALGGRISYWDTAGNAVSSFTYFGTGASGLGVGAGIVCNTWVTPAS
jgi:prepilin-type N-terminal cleavage/methylation domain-containing protein